MLKRRLSASLGVVVLLIAGCQKDPAAGLNELPSDVARTLQPVPNTHLLASRVERVVSEAPAQPAALCPANASVTRYDAQITMPLTVCQDIFVIATGTKVVFFSTPDTATHKLTDAGVFAGLKDGKLWRPPFFCSTSNGPWSARISATRGCTGTCAPANSLIVVNVPNTVHFVWVGPFANHPPGFEFAGEPTVTSQQDLGPCNPLGGGGTGGGGIPIRR